MDWKVSNALSRDVERQHLNKILADIRANVASTSVAPTTNTVTNTVNNRYAVARFILTLAGDVQGSATIDGLGDVTLTTSFSSSAPLGIEEAPINNQFYWRWNGEWKPVSTIITSLQYLEDNGFLAIENNKMVSRQIAQGTHFLVEDSNEAESWPITPSTTPTTSSGNRAFAFFSG